jgi:PAS domain S-box-containing protein
MAECRPSCVTSPNAKQAENALRESEKQLAQLYAAMNEGLALHEIVADSGGQAVDYRLLDVNPAFERIIGIGRDRAVGALASALLLHRHAAIPGGLRPRRGDRSAGVVRDRNSRRWPKTFISPSSVQQRASLRPCSPTSPGANRPRRSWRLRTGRLRALIDNATAMIYVCDFEGRFVLVNAALAALLETTPSQLIGRRRHEFMPQADADAHEPADRKVISAGQAVEFEERSDLPPAARSLGCQRSFPLRDEQGRIYAVAGIVTDITERKQAEVAQQRMVSILQATLESHRRWPAGG